MIQKAQAEEKRVYLDNRLDCPEGDGEPRARRCRVPPPPVLLCRTDEMMAFKPAPWIPSGGEKVRSQ